jgi:cyclophilin family peptidyl-prolyl cis-trans isomerase
MKLTDTQSSNGAASIRPVRQQRRKKCQHTWSSKRAARGVALLLGSFVFPAFGKVIEGMDVVERIAAQPADGVSKQDAVKGQILTKPVAIETASRR